MAIKYNEIKTKLETDPFSDEELKLINECETYIDEKIRKDFDNDYHGVSIDLTISSFKYSPKRGKVLSEIKEVRKSLMSKEIEKRFKTAGWKLTYHIDDGLDGNMSGGDYLILKGKK